MADEDWDNVDESGNAVAAAAGAAPIMAEMPEIKLFGKWSCDDVEVVDMSLQVRLTWNKTCECLHGTSA